MAQELFRQEPIKAKARSQEGSVVPALPLRFSLFSIGICLIICICAVITSLVPIEDRASVTGYITSEKRVTRIISPFSGKVSRLFVANNQRVSQGTPLLEVEATENQDLGDSSQKELATLMQEEMRVLRSNIDFWEAARKDLWGKKGQITEHQKAELRGLRMQLELRKKITELERRRESRLINSGANGSISLYEQEKSKIDGLRAAVEEVETQRQLSAFSLQISQESLASAEREQQIQENIFSLQRSLIEKQGQLKRLTSTRKETILKASSDGTVASLQTFAGDMFQQGKQLLDIVPENTENEIMLLIPTRMISLVQVGQRAYLNVIGTERRLMKPFEGEITEVSKSVLSPSEVQAPSPPTEPVYIAKAKILWQAMNPIDQAFLRAHLYQGMVVDSHVVLRKEVAMAWFISSFLGRRI